MIAGCLGGVAASDQAKMGFLIGAAAGDLVGLVIAGTIFGAIAALFQIADSTAKTARAMEKLEARTPRI